MADADPQPADAPALADVLRSVGRELSGLGRTASGLQDALGPLAAAGGPGGGGLYELQALDALTQSLHGVSDFLGALAETVPAGWTCDAARAARAVALSDLARRLRGGSPPEALPAQGGGAGEFELFED